ncbi:hypothetical protein NL676_008398 [Syzygium grande]|nr:hypothetical protein NL676_008398 [Syzygium grande]
MHGLITRWTQDKIKGKRSKADEQRDDGRWLELTAAPQGKARERERLNGVTEAGGGRIFWAMTQLRATLTGHAMAAESALRAQGKSEPRAKQ